MSKKFAPVLPGEILPEEFLQPMGMSQYRLAKDTSVHPRHRSSAQSSGRLVKSPKPWWLRAMTHNPRSVIWRVAYAVLCK
jgi:hypothetical protein